MQKLLMRADDLGYSEGVNYGIAKSVIDGIIGSVGIMTNMPAIKHGLKLLEGTDVCLGQHTNICIGKPLTDPSLIPSITNENGEFKSSREYREATEDFVVLEEVMLEIEAQYERFIQLTGQKPSYFEGHAIASENFFKGLELVAHKHNLKYSPYSLGGSIPINGKVVKLSMDAMKPNYEPFEALKHFIEQSNTDAELINMDKKDKNDKDSYLMFVCHPGYLDGYILKHSSLTLPRVLEVDMLCDPSTLQWLQEKDVELITYHDL